MKRKNPLYFFLKDNQSPTHYNLKRYLKALGWRKTRLKWRAHFSEENLQFNLAAAQQLEYKHLLSELASRCCPESIPLTFSINDHNWPTILNQMATNYYLKDKQVVDKVDNLVWILKPALLNNGQHIKIFQRLSEIEMHFLSSRRLGGEHVLQQYVINPQLLRNEYKYSIRMFVVTTNYAGSFLYPYGYYNVALHPFSAQEFSDLRPHLTNEHLYETEANIIQIPSQRFDSFPPLYAQIKTILDSLMQGLAGLHPQAFCPDKKRRLALYGFDFMVDSKERVWLIEANHGPCFPIMDTHPLQNHLYYDFWQALIAAFIRPIALNQPLHEISYSPFAVLSLAKI